MGLAGRVNRIRKYDKPVRVFIENRAHPDRRAQVIEVIADIAKHIPNLDMAVVENRDEANYIGRKIVHSLEPQCLSGFRKDENYRIIGSDVILAVDVGDFIFYDCAYEELLQALGPIRDDPTVPWTMFNDDVQMGFFDIYDQYILNILYDPRIRPGMTRKEVRALLPEIMPRVRAWVARVNGLKP